MFELAGRRKLNIFLTVPVGIGVTFLAWQLFAPRFQLPDEITGTPCAAALESCLFRATANQGWYKTTASLTNLRDHDAFVREFDTLVDTPFQGVDLFWCKLRTSHVFRFGGPSAPSREFVIALDRTKSSSVWTFCKEDFEADFVSFVADMGYSVRTAEDVSCLCRLWHLSIPQPAQEYEISEVHGRWVCDAVQDRSRWHLVFSFNDRGIIEGVEFRQ